MSRNSIEWLCTVTRYHPVTDVHGNLAATSHGLA
jgi:hypothetical protein